MPANVTSDQRPKQDCTCTDTCARRGKPFPSEWSWRCQGFTYVLTELDMHEKKLEARTSKHRSLQQEVQDLRNHVFNGVDLIEHLLRDPTETAKAWAREWCATEIARGTDETSSPLGRTACDCKRDGNGWMIGCGDKAVSGEPEKYCQLTHQPCEHCPEPAGHRYRQQRGMPSVEPKCQHDLLKPDTTVRVDETRGRAYCLVCDEKWNGLPVNGSEKQT